MTAFAAFIAGWVIYMIAVLLMPYTGFETMIGYIFIQPILAAITSGVFVFGSLVLGFLLRIVFGKFWHFGSLVALPIVGICLFFMLFGFFLGLKSTGYNPETHQPFEMLNVWVALIAYSTLIFAVTNWDIAVDVTGLLGRWKEIVDQGNARKVVVKREDGTALMEMPLTWTVAGVVLAPILAAAGAITAAVARCKIVVEKRDEP